MLLGLSGFVLTFRELIRRILPSLLPFLFGCEFFALDAFEDDGGNLILICSANDWCVGVICYEQADFNVLEDTHFCVVEDCVKLEPLPDAKTASCSFISHLGRSQRLDDVSKDLTWSMRFRIRFEVPISWRCANGPVICVVAASAILSASSMVSWTPTTAIAREAVVRICESFMSTLA